MSWPGNSEQVRRDTQRDPVDTWHGLFWTMPRGVRFPCNVCLELFPTMLSLSTHLKMHQKPTCYGCWIVFHTAEDLEHHQLQHHAERYTIAPHNFPVKIELDEEVHEDVQENRISFDPQMIQLVTSSPKLVCVAEGTRLPEPFPEERKNIVTRSGRKIILSRHLNN